MLQKYNPLFSQDPIIFDGIRVPVVPIFTNFSFSLRISKDFGSLVGISIGVGGSETAGRFLDVPVSDVSICSGIGHIMLGVRQGDPYRPACRYWKVSISGGMQFWEFSTFDSVRRIGLRKKTIFFIIQVVLHLFVDYR